MASSSQTVNVYQRVDHDFCHIKLTILSTLLLTISLTSKKNSINHYQPYQINYIINHIITHYYPALTSINHHYQRVTLQYGTLQHPPQRAPTARCPSTPGPLQALQPLPKRMEDLPTFRGKKCWVHQPKVMKNRQKWWVKKQTCCFCLSCFINTNDFSSRNGWLNLISVANMVISPTQNMLLKTSQHGCSPFSMGKNVGYDDCIVKNPWKHGKANHSCFGKYHLTIA